METTWLQKRSVTIEEQLEHLGIEIDDLDSYFDLFLRDRLKSRFSILRHDGNWPQCSYPWTVRHIVEHLSGGEQLAISYSDQVSEIMLDLDCHGKRKRSDAVNLAIDAMACIPGDPLVFQSSDSGGIRLEWFTEQSYNRSDLRKWVCMSLHAQKIPLVGGLCEVRLGQAPDRLPFGTGSVLLDPISFELIHDFDLRRTIKYARELKECQASLLTEKLEQDGLRKTVALNEDSFARELYKTGLPVNRSTNDCLMILNRYLRGQKKLPPDATVLRLRNWICDRHNGNSNRVNSGRIKVIYEQIDRIVFSKTFIPYQVANPNTRTGLSNTEFCLLLAYPLSLCELRGLFKILIMAKVRLDSRNSLNSPSLANLRKRNRDGTIIYGREFTENDTVTFRAENSCPIMLDLSKNLLRKLCVPGSENPRVFLAKLREFGIVTLKRKAYVLGNKCRQFWVNFPLEASGANDFADFDQALWKILGYNGIKSRFGPHYARKYRGKFELGETTERQGRKAR